MDHVKLYTAAGEYVTDVALPAFKPPPGAIIWGQRIFVWQQRSLHDTRGTYREAFAYHVPPDLTRIPGGTEP